MESASEVARLRERIALEYQAANRIFQDFTPTARHAYITKREESIAACYQELTNYMTPEEAIVVLSEVEQAVHGCVSSSGNTS